MPVEAVYEGGVVKPLEPLKLKDGQRVGIDIEGDFIEASFGIVKSGIFIEGAGGLP